MKFGPGEVTPLVPILEKEQSGETSEVPKDEPPPLSEKEENPKIGSGFLKDEPSPSSEPTKAKHSSALEVPEDEPSSSSFKIEESSVHISETGNQADILFIIDNSQSMQEEQMEVARKISNFFSKIQGLDWRVGIITTDPYRFDPRTRRFKSYADGALLPFPEGSSFLDSTMDPEEQRTFFAETIFREEEGNGHERGLHNLYRAVERSMSPENGADEDLALFFRPEASLSVILISDENETKRDGVGAPLRNLHKSEPENLVSLVKEVWGDNKRFQFHSIIVRPGDNHCLGDFENFGVEYEKLSVLTGGMVQDICSHDYSGVLDNIGEGVVSLQKTFSLACEPQDENGDGQVDFRIETHGGVPSYKLEGAEIHFSDYLSPGDYEFIYSCLD